MRYGTSLGMRMAGRVVLAAACVVALDALTPVLPASPWTAAQMALGLFASDARAEGTADAGATGGAGEAAGGTTGGTSASVSPAPADPGSVLDTDIRAMGAAAEAAYAAGSYEEAARLYLDLARLEITNGGTIYNLACCYGLLGDDARAGRFLARAWKAGYRDIGQIQRDTDFTAVRGKRPFDAVVDSLGRIAAREDSARGTLIRIDAPTRVSLRIKLPDGYDPSKTWPLVLGLHGYGSSPDQFMRLWNRVEHHDFIYATLQAPYAFDVGGPDLGYGWAIRGDSVEAARMLDLDAGEVAEAVRQLKSRYPVGKVYALGFSQGAHLALTIGMRRPGLLDGILAFGGWLEPGEAAAGPGTKPPVFIAHGKEDSVIPFEAGAEAAKMMRTAGYVVEQRAFDGPHTVDPASLNAGLDWMFRSKR